MPSETRKARDLQLLDAIDGLARDTFTGAAWRVVSEGRSPLLAAPSLSRWCDNSFAVLYTSLDRDGALAERFALLSSQPVFPSKQRSFVHRLSVEATDLLRLPDLAALSKLGVDVGRYAERLYNRTQQIADAARFLGFNGLVVPSARAPTLALVLFADALGPETVRLDVTEADPVDWNAWRRLRRQKS